MSIEIFGFSGNKTAANPAHKINSDLVSTGVYREEHLRNSQGVLERALAEDKREGLRLAVKARWIALSIIAVFLPFLNPNWDVLYYEALLAGFALIGLIQFRIGRVGRSRAELLLIFSDLALMTFVLVVPNPFLAISWPVAMQYHFDNFAYFYVLLASATLAYSWRTISAMGVWTSIIWLLGLAWVLFQPVTHPELSEAAARALQGNPKMLEFLDPNNVHIGARVQEIVIFIIVANILALSSWRTSRLLLKQAAAERERANLSRYFPPNIVDQLADRDQPLGAVRTQPVAVMFADIIGFTRTAERQSPEQVVAMLREFHARMERTVFDNHGTLDKFLGDGLMTTFGTPDPGPQDGSNAIRCLQAMLASMDDWNRDRLATGAEPVCLAIGVHYGDVVLGEVGSERRLEFTVLGDVALPEANDNEKCIERMTDFFRRIDHAGARPVSVGGDHAVTGGILKAIAGEQAQLSGGKKVSLLHFDAHTDAFHHIDHFLGAEKSAAHWASYLVHDGHVNPHNSVQVGIRGNPRTLDWLEPGYDCYSSSTDASMTKTTFKIPVFIQ